MPRATRHRPSLICSTACLHSRLLARMGIDLWITYCATYLLMKVVGACEWDIVGSLE
jgi:hypothetical protein